MSSDLSITTLNDFRKLLEKLPAPDENARQRTLAREPLLIKPRGSLGKLEPLVAWLSAWQRRTPPLMENVRLQVFVGTHGVACHGVSAYPPEVTAQMMASYGFRGAAVNHICETFNIDFQVTDIHIDRPTNPFHMAPALSEEDLIEALNIGLSTPMDGLDALCVGETGIGNTTCAAAMSHALYGKTAEFWTGPGTGVTGKAYENKCRIVAEGVKRHESSRHDGLEVMRRLGGRELAAINGAIIAARLKNVPVILDGFTVCSSAACLKAMSNNALDHCMLGHQSREPGHATLASFLNMTSVVQLDMALGEGTGAAMAVPLLRAACRCHERMKTFDEAAVTDRPD